MNPTLDRAAIVDALEALDREAGAAGTPGPSRGGPVC